MKIRAILIAALAAQAVLAAPADPSRWRVVEKALDLNNPDLAAVKAAPASERPAALLKYYRSRFPLPEGAAEVSEKVRKEADEALAHRFKIRQAPPSYRGEFPGFDWNTNGDASGDPGWMWMFHRLQWWRSLASVYLASGDERYMKEWMNEVNSWVDFMFERENRNHLAWRSLETGIRLSLWAEIFPKLAGSPLLDEKTLVNYLFALLRQQELIETRYSKVPDHKLGNFQVIQQSGLLSSALLFREFKSSVSYVENAVRRLKHYQTVVLLPDGVINEFVPGYHQLYPHLFLTALRKCDEAGAAETFDAEYRRRLENCINAMMLWSHPVDGLPLFGDTFSCSTGQVRAKFRHYVRSFPHREDWLYFATSGDRGVAPARLVEVLPDSGYGIMRSSWQPDAFFVVAKNSFDLKDQWHNHFDNMSFELSYGGRRLMVDSGSYSYHGDKVSREQFKSSPFHQTVTLNGANNAVRGRIPFAVEGPRLKALALENEAGEGLLHRRLLVMVENRYLVVLDFLTGGAGGELRSHYQFIPGEVTFSADGARGPGLLVQGDGAGETVREEGFVSYSYGERMPRAGVAFIKHKPAGRPQSFATLIVPEPEAGNCRIALTEPFEGGVRNAVKVELSDGKTFVIDFNWDDHRAELRR